MSMDWLKRSGIKKDDGTRNARTDGPDSGIDTETGEIKNDKASPVIDNERGIPSVNNKGFRSRALPFSLAAIAVAVIAVVWLIPSPQTPVQKAKDDPKATKDQRFDENKTTAVLAPTAPPLPPEPPQQQAASLEPSQPHPLATPNDPIKVIPAPDPRAAPKGGVAAAAQRPLTPLELRQQSKDLIIGDEEKATAAPAGGPSPLAIPTAYEKTSGSLLGGAGAGGQGASAKDPLGDSLRPTIVSGTTAGLLADRTFTMTQGNLLDCSLDVAISSAVAGMTKCTLTRNVYGDDRKVVLLERGTELTGQYQGGLQQGQGRLFILWTRAKTPKGVLINLNSPGTDALGRGGVDGYINSHFWERFGAALFLSVVNDGMQVLTAKAQNSGGNGTTVVFPQNTAEASKNAAAIAVENDIHIPPTLEKNQGEHVSVFVARDLDFRSVYAVKAVDTGE